MPGHAREHFLSGAQQSCRDLRMERLRSAIVENAANLMQRGRALRVAVSASGNRAPCSGSGREARTDRRLNQAVASKPRCAFQKPAGCRASDGYLSARNASIAGPTRCQSGATGRPLFIGALRALKYTRARTCVYAPSRRAALASHSA